MPAGHHIYGTLKYMIVYVAGKGGFTHEICKVGEEYHFPKNAMTKLYMYDFKLKDGGGGRGHKGDRMPLTPK